MKIAFIRLGLPIELDLFSASTSTLGTEIRLGLFRDWIKIGYKITLFSFLKKKDQKFLFNPPKNEKWLKKIKYDINNLPQDEDVLFIEMGVANFMYSYNQNGKMVRYMDRIIDCIANFKGKIIYYQHGMLPIPLRSISNQLKKWYKKDIFENEWIILHHFNNQEKVKKFFKEYKDFSVKFKFIPLGYSNEDPFFEINPFPKLDLIFIGSQWDSASKTKGYVRGDEIRKFYDDSGLISAIFGKWEEKEKEKFNNVIFMGQSKFHGEAYEIWNKTWGCVWTTSSKIKELGLIPTRPIMVLRAGGLLLADKSIFGIENLVNKKYLVSNAEDVKFILKRHKKLYLEDREEIRKQQLKYFITWDKINWKDI